MLDLGEVHGAGVRRMSGGGGEEGHLVQWLCTLVLVVVVSALGGCTNNLIPRIAPWLALLTTLAI